MEQGQRPYPEGPRQRSVEVRTAQTRGRPSSGQTCGWTVFGSLSHLLLSSLGRGRTWGHGSGGSGHRESVVESPFR